MELSTDAHVRRAGSLEIGEGAVVLPPSEENRAEREHRIGSVLFRHTGDCLAQTQRFHHGIMSLRVVTTAQERITDTLDAPSHLRALMSDGFLVTCQALFIV